MARTFTGRHPQTTDLSERTFSGGGEATVTDLLLTPPDPSRVAFISDRGSFICRLLAVAPVGGGGIDPQARPGRRPLTPYHNPDALGLTMSILLDGLRDSEPVEDRCRIVELMAGMFMPDDPGPVDVLIRGKAVPHCWGAEALRHRWLISEAPGWGTDVGPELVRDRKGRRVRQQVDLTWLLSTDSDALDRIKPRQGKPDHRPDRARKGDTWKKIARRELGSPHLGKKLAELNGRRDPNEKLKEGRHIRLPSKHLKDVWEQALKEHRL
jgi:hypothetical protein